MVKYIFVLLISLLLLTPLYASQVIVCNNMKFNFYPGMNVYAYVLIGSRNTLIFKIMGSESLPFKTPFTIQSMAMGRQDCPTCKQLFICPQLNNRTFTSNAFINITNAKKPICTVTQSNCR